MNLLQELKKGEMKKWNFKVNIKTMKTDSQKERKRD